MLKGALPARSSLSRNLCLWPHLCSPSPFPLPPPRLCLPQSPFSSHGPPPRAPHSKLQAPAESGAKPPSRAGPRFGAPKPPQARARTLAN